MDMRLFEDPKRASTRTPKINHVTWVKSLIAKHSAQEAYRIIRPLAVPLFIYRKESTMNENFGFYKNALNWLKKHHPYQSKQGGVAK